MWPSVQGTQALQVDVGSWEYEYGREVGQLKTGSVER
jgi:hypothetical protein